MEWYYSIAGQRFGPVSEAEFQKLRDDGQIQPGTLVWHAGLAEWMAFSSFDTTAPAPPSAAAAGTLPCSVCGRPFPPPALLPFGDALLCSDCKDPYFQRLREQGTGALRAGRRFGGFWIRALAILIDTVILALLMSPFSILFVFLTSSFKISARAHPEDVASNLATLAVLLALYVLFEVSVAVIYEAWFLVRRGATPGKMILGLEVIRTNNGYLTWGRAVGRVFARMLSSFTFYIGFIIAGFDSEKRALHDYICDTRVVHRSA